MIYYTLLIIYYTLHIILYIIYHILYILHIIYIYCIWYITYCIWYYIWYMIYDIWYITYYITYYMLNIIYDIIYIIFNFFVEQWMPVPIAQDFFFWSPQFWMPVTNLHELCQFLWAGCFRSAVSTYQRRHRAGRDMPSGSKCRDHPNGSSDGATRLLIMKHPAIRDPSRNGFIGGFNWTSHVSSPHCLVWGGKLLGLIGFSMMFCLEISSIILDKILWFNHYVNWYSFGST